MTTLPNDSLLAQQTFTSQDSMALVSPGPLFVDVSKIQAIFKDDIFHMLLKADNTTVRDAIEACEAMAQGFSANIRD